MTGQCKPSEGPWNVDEDDSLDGVPFIPVSSGDFGPDYISICDVRGNGNGDDDLAINDQDRARANFIAEAGTVYHETKLTPRQLLAQRDELLAALKQLVKAVSADDDIAAWAELFDANTAIANAEKE